MLGEFISTPMWQAEFSDLAEVSQVRALPALGSPGPPVVLPPLLSPHTLLWASHPTVAPFV